MAWPLYYRAASAPSLEAFELALAAWAGRPVERNTTDWSGDPWNGYGQSTWLRTESVDGGTQKTQLSAYVIRRAQYADETVPYELESVPLRLEAPSLSVAQRLGRWGDLTEALRPLGYRDATLEGACAVIVDDLQAAGEVRRAGEMRRAITAALVSLVPTHASVMVSDTRPDNLDAVLNAYTRPEAKVSVALSGLELTALPARLARFAGVQMLSLDRNPLDASALRGWHFEHLTWLSLSATRTVDVTADDLRGLPGLRNLNLSGTPLRSIEPAVRMTCPHLAHIDISDTPLSRDEAACAELRDTWPELSFPAPGRKGRA